MLNKEQQQTLFAAEGELAEVLRQFEAAERSNTPLEEVTKLSGEWIARVINSLVDMREAAWCCIVGCSAAATVNIQGDSGHPEDNTQSCDVHIGESLGTPVGLPMSTSWTVVPIENDEPASDA